MSKTCEADFQDA